VQIWDPNCERDFKLGCQKGSDGLWNNAPGSEGKHPLVKADKPTGEWNTMRMCIQGDDADFRDALPDAYTKPQRTTLKQTVGAGGGTVDLQLDSTTGKKSTPQPRK
jgi:hypothetical protein